MALRRRGPPLANCRFRAHAYSALRTHVRALPSHAPVQRSPLRAHERGLLACARGSALVCTGRSCRDREIAAACEGSCSLPSACPIDPLSARLLRALQLPVWAEVLSALTRSVAVALLPPRFSGLICVTPSLTALLCATLLSAPHRHRHQQHHKHDRARYRDHDDAAANRERDKGGAHRASPSAKPVLQHTRHGPSSRSRSCGPVAA